MKKLKKITDPGRREQLMFADNAAVQRNAESGLDYKPIGAINAAKRVGEGCPVLVYNAGTSVAYVKFGDQTVTGPFAADTAIPVLAGEKFMVNSGSSSWIIGSSNQVFAYTGDNEE